MSERIAFVPTLFDISGDVNSSGARSQTRSIFAGHVAFSKYAGTYVGKFPVNAVGMILHNAKQGDTPIRADLSATLLGLSLEMLAQEFKCQRLES